MLSRIPLGLTMLGLALPGLAMPGLALLGLALLGAGSARAAEPDAAGIEFFEKKIRPVLVKHCYECHAADSKEIKGGLQLDNRASLLQGGDSGAAVVPGEVDEGTLLAALRQETFEMPPTGKLSEAVIADFARWIQLGAPDPRQGESVAERAEIDIEKGRQFWSFQPPWAAQPPTVNNSGWPQGDVDRFILARLEQAGLEPARDADRETLIRRLYFDLIGLPPRPEEIDAFVADESPRAYEKLVDSLLASHHFGQRWGRHWLDVARFAESSGGGRTLMFKNAWRYRDYVIRSFNQDKPFDRFLAEQIAGDLLPAETIQQQADGLTGLGFLMLGPNNYELQDKELLRLEVIDEQIDVMGKAVLAMSIGCARCHDHKFDPIPTRDYYALTGIFYSTKSLLPGNVSGFVERELPLQPQQAQRLREYRRQVAAIGQRLDPLQAELKRLKEQLAGKFDLMSLAGIVLDDLQATKTGVWKNSRSIKPFLQDGYLHDQNRAKGTLSVRYTPDLPADGLYEVRVSYAAGTNRAVNTPITIHHADGRTTLRIDQTQPGDVGGLFLSLGQFRFERGTHGSVVISNEGTKAHVIADAVQWISLGDHDAEGAAAGGTGGEGREREDDRPMERLKLKIAQANKQIQPLKAELAALKKDAPPAPPMVMSVQDEQQPGDYHLLLQGRVRNLGPKVPRGFLQVATTAAAEPAEISPDQSGRLELARWLSSRDNPLTARVAVNRIWRHLFGAGIVHTPDNFGRTGEPPTHPQLLDYLAVQFMQEGWSIKRMIRRLVLSRSYRLSSRGSDAAASLDPENRLLSHASRRRLEAEAIRDAVLTVSGHLDSTSGGPSFPPSLKSEFDFDFTSDRRSIYVAVFRNTQHELFEVFDLANPNLVSGNRNTSTLATQALFLMNSPMMMDRSRQAAGRLLSVEGLDDDQRLALAYRRALGRLPSEGERELALRFLGQLQQEATDSAERELAAWSHVFQTLFACIDFRYVN